MSPSYSIGERIEARHQEHMEILISTAGDLAMIRDAIKANTSVMMTVAAHLSKLVTLSNKASEEGSRHD